MASKKYVAKRFEGIGVRFWLDMYNMVRDNNPVDLGAGYPNYNAESETILKALVDITLKGDHQLNQYTRGYGHPRLVNSLAKLYSKLMNRQIDPFNEILVTIGAYGAIFCSAMGILNPGDEVIVIDPHYDCYVPIVKIAGGVPVFVPLRRQKTIENGTAVESSGNWKLDEDELRSKFTSKTKMIIINTPNNPTGKVYTRSELEMIADLCKKHDVIVVMDEVYEWLVYKDNNNKEHFKMATLPGMFERTITIGSVGKSFSVTGWKIGWAITSPEIRTAMAMALQNSVYLAATNLQEAIAITFEKEMELMMSGKQTYFDRLCRDLENKRDKIVSVLKSHGMKPIVPEGSYFIICDYTEMAKKIDLTADDDGRGENIAFCRWLSRHKLQGTPLSVFYSDEFKHLGAGLIRFCFFKKDETIEQADVVLKKVKDMLSI